MDLYSDIKYLKGIGPKRATALARLNITNLEDLVTFFPKSYQDRRNITKIQDILFSEHYCIFGTIQSVHEQKVSRSLSIFTVEIKDDTGTVFGKIFRKVNPYSKTDLLKNIRESFQTDKLVYVYGIASIKFGQKQISIEDYETVETKEQTTQFNKLVPIYNLTAGITHKVISSSVKYAIDNFSEVYPDIISQYSKYTENLKLLPISHAIKRIHFPKTLEEAELARQSFALQEFLLLQLIMLISKKKTKTETKVHKYEIKKTLLTPFKNQLKFEFTKAQKKVINEIFADMTSKKTMNRMLMGDVGSGKTVVALSAILLAVENNYQALIVAPTEILAEQHFLTFSNMLKGLNINIELVTASTLKTKKQREEILSNIENGKTNIIVGTHSVIEDRVKFKDLSLVVVDEQHRFGVMQKLSALSKGKTVDILMMTATPIPRGLAMTIYGEMAVSVIDQLPPNRTPIETLCLTEFLAYSKAKEEISKGGQVYIVFPLVDESDKLELKSAIQEAQNLSQTVFKQNKVGLLHGKMKPKEKNEIMQQFKDKQFDILIATTVIEVGIDVPNATTIIIQHADRYGLATLHQLRGRVGRGAKKSYCLLVADAKSKNAKDRLSIMTKTTNGFEIASEDLKMRGPGEFIGTRQHGFPEFKAGDIIKDIKIIELAKNIAQEIIQKDAKLVLPENNNIKLLLNKKYSSLYKTIQVG